VPKCTCEFLLDYEEDEDESVANELRVVRRERLGVTGGLMRSEMRFSLSF
jgi:hypothetical protein